MEDIKVKEEPMSKIIEYITVKDELLTEMIDKKMPLSTLIPLYQSHKNSECHFMSSSGMCKSEIHSERPTEQNATLRCHMNTSNGEKPFQYDECEYSSSRKASLSTPMNTHTEEKPFQLDDCDYSASQKAHLRRPLTRHTGERPFQCEECDYSASQKAHLRRHMITHSGERPCKTNVTIPHLRNLLSETT